MYPEVPGGHVKMNVLMWLSLLGSGTWKTPGGSDWWFALSSPKEYEPHSHMRAYQFPVSSTTTKPWGRWSWEWRACIWHRKIDPQPRCHPRGGEEAPLKSQLVPEMPLEGAVWTELWIALRICDWFLGNGKLDLEAFWGSGRTIEKQDAWEPRTENSLREKRVITATIYWALTKRRVWFKCTYLLEFLQSLMKGFIIVFKWQMRTRRTWRLRGTCPGSLSLYVKQLVFSSGLSESKDFFTCVLNP